MKTHHVKQSVERIGQVEESTFRIRASATSFSILSSGLYSNKILAIARELSCNAYDAHVMANKKHVPFEITLPRSLNPNFVIKDFGTGLSHEEVMTLYTTYFESTKGDSDDMIGQLGLGSKSPFSYTNQFMVESRQHGKVNVYSMYINEDGVPACSHLGEQDTTEENGITITLAVKPEDNWRFRDEVASAIMYFDPYPVVHGDHPRKEFKYRLQKDTWAIREEKNKDSKPYVIQGFVRYPLDSNQINNFTQDDLELSPEARALLEAPIDFIVPIGLVQVAPSREHLSYDKRTIVNLVNYINEVAIDITESLQSMIDSAPSLWDARIMASTFMVYGSVFRQLYEKLIDRKFVLQYNGTPLSHMFNVTEVDITGMQMTEFRRNKQYRSYSKKFETMVLRQHVLDLYKKRTISSEACVCITSRTKIIHNDIYVSSVKLKDYLETIMDSGDNVIELKSEDKNTSIANQVATFVAAAGMPDTSQVILVSDLVAKGSIDISKKPRVAKVAPEKGSRKIFTGSSGQTCYWADQMVDFKQGGYYVTTHRGCWMLGNLHQSWLRQCIAYLKEEKILPENVEVVSVPQSDVQRFAKATNWLDIQHMLEAYIKGHAESISTSRANKAYRRDDLRFDDDVIKRICAEAGPHSYWTKFMNAHYSRKERAANSSMSNNLGMVLNSVLFRDTSIIPHIEALTEKKTEEIQTIDDLHRTYPMMELIHALNSWWINPRAEEILTAHIKDIDQRIKQQQQLEKCIHQADIITETV